MTEYYIAWKGDGIMYPHLFASQEQAEKFLARERAEGRTWPDVAEVRRTPRLDRVEGR